MKQTLTAVAIACCLLLPVGSAHATPVTILFITASAVLSTSGDALDGIALPEAWGLGAGQFGQTMTADSLTLNLTDFSYSCQGVGQAGCSFTIVFFNQEAIGFAGTSLATHLDGTASASTPGGIEMSTNFDALNEAGYSIMQTYGLLLGSASFAGTWNAALGTDPSRQGPITGFRGSLTVSGLWEGDSIRFPGSMGVAMAAPVTTVPEPASLLLLGTGLAGAVRAARKRRR